MGISLDPMTTADALHAVVKAMGDQLEPTDVGLVKLLDTYARALDERGSLVQVLAGLEAALAKAQDEPSAYGTAYALAIQLDKLKAGLDAHKILADIGPRLLIALDALGATPKARAQIQAIAAKAAANLAGPTASPAAKPAPAVKPDPAPAAASEPAADEETPTAPVLVVEDRVAQARADRLKRQAQAAGLS